MTIYGPEMPLEERVSALTCPPLALAGICGRGLEGVTDLPGWLPG